MMVLVSTYQFSDDELSAILQLRSEGLSEMDVKLLLTEYEDQDHFDDVTLTKEPSKRGGPARQRPGSKRRRQTLFDFLMKRLSARRKRTPRPHKGSQHRPRLPRPSYHQPNKHSYPTTTYDFSQIASKPSSTNQPDSHPYHQQTTTESVPVEVSYEPVSSTPPPYTEHSSSTSAPSYPENPDSDHTSPSSPISYQNSEVKNKFRFPPFPFASLERDTFFDNFKSKF